ncbi:MAG: heparinase II/III-family protein [Opitutaceae bacterium]|nr:heparinase II/III-family protein [Opitutaceae bacterium]
MTSTEWPDINDSWHDSHVVSALAAPATWAPRLGVQQLTATGLIRGASEAGWRWLFDVGDVSPAFNPGHSHSDVLSLMLHWTNDAILVDPGVLHYSPNDERRFLRSCHAHNGPCLASEDHTEFAGSFRVGRSVGAVDVAVSETEGEPQARGSYCYPRGVAIHRRLSVAGNTVRLVDTWTSRSGRPIVPWLRFLWAFEPSQLEVMFPHVQSLVFTTKPTASGSRWGVSMIVRGVERPRLSVGESFRAREFGRTVPATETVFTASCNGAEISVETSITRLTLEP